MKRILSMVLCLILCAIPMAVQGEETIEIGYMSWNGGAQQVSEEAYFAAYEAAHPGVKINAEFIPWDNYYNKLNTLIAANSCPDIFFTSEDTLINYADKGLATDLRPLYEAKGVDMLSTFHPGTMYADGDKVYSIANGLSCLVMFYNKQLFEEKGVQPPSLDPENPWTWEQYVEAAKALTADSQGRHPGEEGFDVNAITTFGSLAPTWNRMWLTLLYSAGGSLATEDGMALNFDNEPTRRVFQSISDLMLVDHVAPAAAISKSLPSTPQMFKDNQLAMAMDGAWGYINFRNEDIDVGVAPLPMFDKPMSIAWGSAYILSTQSKHPQEAFDFLSEFIDPNKNPDQLTYMQPNMLDMYAKDKLSEWISTDDFYNDDFRTTIPPLITEVAIAGENVKLKDFGPIADQTITPILDNLWLGSMTVDQAIKECYTKTEGMFKGY